MKNKKYSILILTLILSWQVCLSQDTNNLELQIDTTLNIPIYSYSISSIGSEYSIFHNPSKEDSIFSLQYSNLINAEPTKKNHSNYHSLACSLWQLGRLEEAEIMFLKIIDSKESYYTRKYYNSSDVPFDTTSNTYVYGSSTSSYKNYACRYLSKIYIEENKFKYALKYTEHADKKYIVEHNCGTGNQSYRREIDGLYGLAYEGLEMYENIINMFLPQYSNHSNGILIRALKKVYTQTELNKHLNLAEKSIVCVVDTFQSSSFIATTSGDNHKSTSDVKYTSGKATMTLFNKLISLPIPKLEDGEKVTREHFIKEFKESDFYTNLIYN